MPGSIIVPNPAVHSTNEKKKKEKYRQPNGAHQKTFKKKIIYTVQFGIFIKFCQEPL